MEINAKMAAKSIRQELKKLYPQIKFSVTSGWGTVWVEYTHPEPEIKEPIYNLLAKYQATKYSAIDDYHDYKDNNECATVTANYVFIRQNLI